MINLILLRPLGNPAVAPPPEAPLENGNEGQAIMHNGSRLTPVGNCFVGSWLSPSKKIAQMKLYEVIAEIRLMNSSWEMMNLLVNAKVLRREFIRERYRTLRFKLSVTMSESLAKLETQGILDRNNDVHPRFKISEDVVRFERIIMDVGRLRNATLVRAISIQDDIDFIPEYEKVPALTCATIWGTPSISRAVFNGHSFLEEMRIRIQLGADINRRVEAAGIAASGTTPLLSAIRAGAESQAKLLIDAKADVNRRGGEGCLFTPLTQACERGNSNMVRMLLDAGADVRLRDGHNLSLMQLQSIASCVTSLMTLVFLLSQSPQAKR